MLYASRSNRCNWGFVQISDDTGVRVTNGELRSRTIRAADNLSKLGYARGDVFAVVAGNNEHFAKTKVTEKELLNFVPEELKYLRLFFVEDLPTTPSGKTDRNQVKELARRLLLENPGELKLNLTKYKS